MRDTPPQPPCTPSPPLSAGKSRRVAFMAHYAACGVILSLRKHPQAASCAVCATPKKKVSLSLSLGNTPKCSRMSAPMPRGIPHLPSSLLLSLHTTPTVWRVQCLLQCTEQPSLALLHLLLYYFYYFYYFLLVRKQHCCARLLARKALLLRCCCPFTNCSPHTHTYRRRDIDNASTCIQRGQSNNKLHTQQVWLSCCVRLSFSLSLPLYSHVAWLLPSAVKLVLQ